jgi:hypothetical protein
MDIHTIVEFIGYFAIGWFIGKLLRFFIWGD